MRNDPDLDLDEYLATLAVSRLVLGPKLRLQAPPNLVDLTECLLLLDAGVDDFGGISPLTPDHVNPERPWPELDKLTDLLAGRGYRADRAADRATVLRAGRGAVAGPAGAAARPGAGRPGHRAGRGRAGRRRRAARPACPGRSRTTQWQSSRPHRPARRGRHRGPQQRPAQRLRRGLRRLERFAGKGVLARRDRAGLRRGGRAAGGRARSGRPDRRPGADPDAGRRGRPGRGRGAGRRAAPRRGRRRRHLRRQPQHQLHQHLLHRLPVLRVRPAGHRRRRLHPVHRRDRRPGPRGARRRRDRDLHAGRHRPEAAGQRATSTWPGRSRRRCPRCTCTRSARWRSSTARPGPTCRSRSS